MDCVSIIVPCYNAAAYVSSKARLFAQTYPELEFVLVDDCSQDDTWQKLEALKLELSNHRITIARNEKNMGPGPTRNRGLELSSGQYVCFWDIDDEPDPEYIAKMLDTLKREHADFVCCGYFFHQGNIRTTCLIEQKLLEAPNSKELKHNVFSFFGAPWNKLVRRDFLEQHQISFPPFRYGEENMWTLQLVLHAEKIALLNEPLYNYFRMENSVTSWRTQVVVENMCDQLRYEYALLHQKELFDSRMEAMWYFKAIERATIWWHRLDAHADLQRLFAKRFSETSKALNLKLNVKEYPISCKQPWYRLLPKSSAKLHGSRERLKSLYNCCKLLQRNKAIFDAIAAAAASED